MGEFAARGGIQRMPNCNPKVAHVTVLFYAPVESCNGFSMSVTSFDRAKDCQGHKS